MCCHFFHRSALNRLKNDIFDIGGWDFPLVVVLKSLSFGLFNLMDQGHAIHENGKIIMPTNKHFWLLVSYLK
jgi:hypothetical protein